MLRRHHNIAQGGRGGGGGEGNSSNENDDKFYEKKKPLTPILRPGSFNRQNNNMLNIPKIICIVLACFAFVWFPMSMRKSSIRKKEAKVIRRYLPRRNGKLATEKMLRQSSEFVDGEKKLKKELGKLKSLQEQGKELGVNFKTRWEGENVKHWESKDDTKEEEPKVEQPKAEPPGEQSKVIDEPKKTLEEEYAHLEKVARKWEKPVESEKQEKQVPVENTVEEDDSKVVDSKVVDSKEVDIEDDDTEEKVDSEEVDSEEDDDSEGEELDGGPLENNGKPFVPTLNSTVSHDSNSTEIEDSTIDIGHPDGGPQIEVEHVEKEEEEVDSNDISLETE